MQQKTFLLVGLSHPKIFCPYFVMLPRIKVVPFLLNQWIWGSSSMDCSKEWRTMRPLMPHLSFLKQLTSCCKIAYIKLCGSLRSEINEHSCQMWWTWKACVCKSGWFWVFQKKKIKLYLHQANDGLGDNLMDDTKNV